MSHVERVLSERNKPQQLSDEAVIGILYASATAMTTVQAYKYKDTKKKTAVKNMQKAMDELANYVAEALQTSDPAAYMHGKSEELAQGKRAGTLLGDMVQIGAYAVSGGFMGARNYKSLINVPPSAHELQ